MKRSMLSDSLRISTHSLLAILLCLCVSQAVIAQEARDTVGPQFASGVLTTIPPEVNREDIVNTHDMIELRVNEQLQRDPYSSTKSRTLYEMAESVHFRHDVWCLELSFKPLRMMYVDIPQASGKMQRKLIWYLVYRVRNTGVGLAPQQSEKGTFTTVEKSADSVRFIPEFVLTSQDRDRTGKPVLKSYLDRIIPTAVRAIEQREMQGHKLLNSVEISEQVLEPENGRSVGGLWGVATWEDVDPQIDFFSVFVGGMNNAYRWEDAAESFRLGDPAGKGRKFDRKFLQLNFWRPGDDLAENEREIRFGIAPGKADLYGTGEGVAYRWVYQ